MAAILVVDDDPDLRDLVCAAMRAEGHEVTSSDDGMQALLELGRGDFDLLVTDQQMPVLDGLSVVAALRRGEDDRLPVLLVTGHDDPAVVERARATGVDTFLRKPFSMGELRGAVGRLLVRSSDPEDTPSP